MVLGAKPPRRQRQQQLACGEALQELPLDQPRRYQAELTSRGGGQLCLVTPVWRSRQVRRGDLTPGTKAGQQTLLRYVVIIINRCAVASITKFSELGVTDWQNLATLEC